MHRSFFFLFLLPLPGWAQAPPKALLWEIGGRGLERPSYVVGTVHSRDARAFRQVPRLLRVMGGQDVMAGELDLSLAEEGSRLSVQDILMPPDSSLADLYTPRQMKRVAAAVKEPLGPFGMFMDRIKPIVLLGLASGTVMRADSAMVLDQYLEAKAREMGKEVTGLETAGEQLAAVDRIPLAEQADMLYKAVRKGFGRKEVGRLMDAYAAQDLARLAKITGPGGPSDPLGMHLLTERNQVMAGRMDSLMQQGRTFFFAVGAGHLPGEEGVLARLRGMGYAVEAVDPAGTGR